MPIYKIDVILSEGEDEDEESSRKFTACAGKIRRSFDSLALAQDDSVFYISTCLPLHTLESLL